MATLTKKQLWKENDEWVVVGVKQNKSVEKGWVVVPDKSKGKPVDEPDRVDKILARYAERETDVRPSPLVEALFQNQKTQNAALPRPRRHGVCKRSEAKAFLRHGRVTFEGDVVTRPEQRVVVRYVRGPSARTARLPASGTTWTFSPRRLFFWRSGSRSVAAHAASPRFRPQAVRRRAGGRQAHPRLARRRQGERRPGEGGVMRHVARRGARPRRRTSSYPMSTRVCVLLFPRRSLLYPRRRLGVILGENDIKNKRLLVATFVASSPATAAARERSGDPSRTPARVAGRAPRSDPAINPRARRARRPRTTRPGASRAARAAAATGRPATRSPPGLAR